MKVEFKTLVDTSEEYKITVKVVKDGTEYVEDHIRSLIGLHIKDSNREKDNSISMLIEGLIKNIDRNESNLNRTHRPPNAKGFQ